MNRYRHRHGPLSRVRSRTLAWCVGLLSIVVWPIAQASIVIEQLHQMMSPSSTASPASSLPSSSDAHEETLGIVYIFSSQCPYCQSFSPILADVSRELQLPVYPYSVDGHGLPDFPTPLMAHEAILQVFYRGQPIIYPATFLVNLNNRAFVPLSIGAISREQLIQDLHTYEQHAVMQTTVDHTQKEFDG